MTELISASRAYLQRNPVRGVAAEALAEAFGRTALLRYGDRHIICAENEPGDAMYFLLEGKVRVRRKDSRGKPRDLATVEAPALIGHMSLIDDSLRSASCLCEGRAVVATLGIDRYRELMEESTPAGAALRRVLCASMARQLVSANHGIRELIQRASAPTTSPTTHRPPVPRAAHSTTLTGDRDVSDAELLRIANVLEGWQLNATTADVSKMQVVHSDADLRRTTPRK